MDECSRSTDSRGKLSNAAAGAATVRPSPMKSERAERLIPTNGPASAKSATACRFGGSERIGACVPKRPISALGRGSGGPMRNLYFRATTKCAIS
eukprot:scaffold102017_cov29-Tisochrysis_lutea.AAC.3